MATILLYSGFRYGLMSATQGRKTNVTSSWGDVGHVLEEYTMAHVYIGVYATVK